MPVVDDIETPESALRKRLNRRGTALGQPLEMTPDPVYGAPESTPPPPVVSPGGPVTRSPSTKLPTTEPVQPGQVTPGPYQTQTFKGDGGGDGETPTTPTRPSPTTPPVFNPSNPNVPGMPTGPITSDNDPRLTDPRYGSAKDVLDWLNRPGGPGNYGGGPPEQNPLNQRRGLTPPNGDFRALVHGMLQGRPYNQASLLQIEPLLAQYGISIEPANAAGERTKIRLPNGQVVRLGFGESGWAWVVQPPPGSGGGGAGGAAPVPGGQSEFQNALRAILMQRLAIAQGRVDENDPFIREPMQAAALEAARAQQTERTALAERLAATGDTSRSLEMGIQQSAERNAVGLGTLRAKLINDEYNRKRQEMLDLMQMAIATNDAQAARDIQAALIALDRDKFVAGYNDKAGG